MNRKVRTALYACALMAPLILQSCNAQVKKKRATKSVLKKQTKTLKKRL